MLMQKAHLIRQVKRGNYQNMDERVILHDIQYKLYCISNKITRKYSLCIIKKVEKYAGRLENVISLWILPFLNEIMNAFF